jgi:tetratricopeptide (TPR) repeat protein
VQLIEASTLQHVWAERFDGTLEDVFDLQDDITVKIVGQLLPNVERSETGRASRKKANETGVYDLYLRALHHFHAFSADDISSALRLLEAALRSDPDHARSLALSSVCRARILVNSWDAANDQQHIELGVECANRAAYLSPDDSSVLWMSGFAIGRLSGDYQRGLDLLERSKVLNPNSYYAFGFAGLLKTLSGAVDSAIDDLEHALRLNPIDPRSFTFQTSLAAAYNYLGQHMEARSHAARAIQKNPRYEAAHRQLVVSCQRCNQTEEAREAAAKLMSAFPSFSISDLRQRYERLKQPITVGVRDHFDALREAGLPEG